MLSRQGTKWLGREYILTMQSPQYSNDRTMKSMLVLLLILVMPIQLCSAVEPLIYEEIGTVLTPEGYIGEKGPEMYNSIFLRIEDPLAEDLHCDECDLRRGTLDMLVTSGGCWIKGQIGNGHELSRVSIPQGAGNGGHSKECLRECLRDSRCKGVSVVEPRDAGAVCILRATRFTSLATSREAEAEVLMDCLMPNKTAFCAEFRDVLSTHLKKKNSAVIERVWSRVDHAIKVVSRLKGLNLEEVSSEMGEGREKRSWAVLAPLAGILAGGLSLFESFKVEKQVKNLEKEFDSFADKQAQGLSDLGNKAVHVIGKLTESQEALELRLECDTRQLARQIFTSLRIAEFEQLLSELIDPVSKGMLQGPASLKIIDSEMLLRISRSDKMKGTVYERHPELMSIGRMMLVDAHRRSSGFSVHLILALPAMQSTEVSPLYQSHRVMFRAAEGDLKCGRVEIPTHVMKAGEAWRGVDLGRCSEHGLLRLCSRLDQGPVPCLAPTPEGFAECVITRTDCQTEHEELISGVLIHAVGQVRGTNSSGELPQPTSKQAYYSYNNFSLLTFDGVEMRRMDEGQTELYKTLPATKGEELIRERMRANPGLEELKEWVVNQRARGEKGLIFREEWLMQGCVVISTLLWTMWGLKWGLYRCLKSLWVDRVKDRWREWRAQRDQSPPTEMTNPEYDRVYSPRTRFRLLHREGGMV